MKKYVDELLAAMNTSLAYDEKALHHHIVALTYDAVNGSEALPFDALAMVMFRYEGRIPEVTLEAVAEILGLESGNAKGILNELLKRSGSHISILNRIVTGDKDAEESYASAVTKCREALPKRRRHWLRKKMAESDGRVCYRLMDNAQLLESLRKRIKDISQGIPGSLPQGLCDQLGVTKGTAYVLAYPYLLFDKNRLTKLYEDALAEESKAV